MKRILLPLVVVIIGKTVVAQSEKKEPPPPPPKPKQEINYVVKGDNLKQPPVIKVSGAMAEGFYKRNPSVADISRKGNIITVKKKDGTTEEYDMSKKEEAESFTEKYGVSPIPPPPPPPKRQSKA